MPDIQFLFFSSEIRKIFEQVFVKFTPLIPAIKSSNKVLQIYQQFRLLNNRVFDSPLFKNYKTKKVFCKILN
jgi:hypothetical protein